jgi:hypothetical protein
LRDFWLFELFFSKRLNFSGVSYREAKFKPRLKWGFWVIFHIFFCARPTNTFQSSQNLQNLGKWFLGSLLWQGKFWLKSDQNFFIFGHFSAISAPKWTQHTLFGTKNTRFWAFFAPKKALSTKYRACAHFTMSHMVLNMFGECYERILPPKKFWRSCPYRGYPIGTPETHNLGQTIAIFRRKILFWGQKYQKMRLSTKYRACAHFTMSHMVLNVFGDCYERVLPSKKFWSSYPCRGYPIGTPETHNLGETIAILRPKNPILGPKVPKKADFD